MEIEIASSTGTAAVYFIRLNGRLETDFINAPDGSVIQATRAVGRTTTAGIELTAGAQPVRGLLVDGSFTYQAHQVDDSPEGDLDGKWLRRQPRVMANWGAVMKRIASMSGSMVSTSASASRITPTRPNPTRT